MNIAYFTVYLFCARPKFVINLWHLRSMNGMAYYAIDSLYSAGFDGPIILIFRSRSIAPLFRERFGNQSPFLEVSLLCYVFVAVPILVLYNLVCSCVVDCPTCHPLPFLRNQKIVVHDPYPFVSGSLSSVRRILLFACLLTSRTFVRYINKSDSLLFAERIVKSTLSSGIDYAPNLFPMPVAFTPLPIAPHGLIIGLVGSASSKKNYSFLIERMKLLGFSQVTLLVYGFPTHYLSSVIRSSCFPVNICNSDLCSFDSFFSAVNIVVNISTSEGFCRPVAAAVVSGLPVFLIDSPVTNEFYSCSQARIFSSVDELLIAIAREYPSLGVADP